MPTALVRAQEMPLRSPDIVQYDTRMTHINIKESVTTLQGTYGDYVTVCNPFPLHYLWFIATEYSYYSSSADTELWTRMYPQPCMSLSWRHNEKKLRVSACCV